MYWQLRKKSYLRKLGIKKSQESEFISHNSDFYINTKLRDITYIGPFLSFYLYIYIYIYLFLAETGFRREKVLW